MVGRKSLKPTPKKFLASTGVKTKLGKKLRKNAPANALDPSKFSRLKQLLIQNRGCEMDRLQNRIHQQDFLLADVSSGISNHLILLLRDGLPQRRVDGIVEVLAQITQNPELLLLWGRRLLTELIPRIVDDEECVRHYAIECVTTVLRLAQCHIEDERWQKFLTNAANIVWTQLKLSFTSLQRQKILSGLQLAHRVMKSSSPFMFANNSKFVYQIIPLLTKHLDLILIPGKEKLINKGCLTECALQPTLGKWSGVLIAILLNSFLNVCNSNFHKERIIMSWNDFVNMCQEKPNFKISLNFTATKSFNSRPKQTHDKIKHGSDFLMGKIIGHMEGLMSMLEKSRSGVYQKLIMLITCVLRWMVGFTMLKQVMDDNDIQNNWAPMPCTKQGYELAQLLLNCGQGSEQRTLLFLVQNMQLLTTSLRLCQICKAQDIPWYIKGQVKSYVFTLWVAMERSNCFWDRECKISLGKLIAAGSSLEENNDSLSADCPLPLYSETVRTLHRVFGNDGVTIRYLEEVEQLLREEKNELGKLFFPYKERDNSSTVESSDDVALFHAPSGWMALLAHDE